MFFICLSSVPFWNESFALDAEVLRLSGQPNRPLEAYSSVPGGGIDSVYVVSRGH